MRADPAGLAPLDDDDLWELFDAVYAELLHRGFPGKGEVNPEAVGDVFGISFVSSMHAIEE